MVDRHDIDMIRSILAIARDEGISVVSDKMIYRDAPGGGYQYDSRDPWDRRMIFHIPVYGDAIWDDEVYGDEAINYYRLVEEVCDRLVDTGIFRVPYINKYGHRGIDLSRGYKRSFTDEQWASLFTQGVNESIDEVMSRRDKIELIRDMRVIINIARDEGIGVSYTTNGLGGIHNQIYITDHDNRLVHSIDRYDDILNEVVDRLRATGYFNGKLEYSISRLAYFLRMDDGVLGMDEFRRIFNTTELKAWTPNSSVMPDIQNIRAILNIAIDEGILIDHRHRTITAYLPDDSQYYQDVIHNVIARLNDAGYVEEHSKSPNSRIHFIDMGINLIDRDFAAIFESSDEDAFKNWKEGNIREISAILNIARDEGIGVYHTIQVSNHYVYFCDHSGRSDKFDKVQNFDKILKEVGDRLVATGQFIGNRRDGGIRYSDIRECYYIMLKYDVLSSTEFDSIFEGVRNLPCFSNHDKLESGDGGISLREFKSLFTGGIADHQLMIESSSEWTADMLELDSILNIVRDDGVDVSAIYGPGYQKYHADAGFHISVHNKGPQRSIKVMMDGVYQRLRATGFLAEFNLPTYKSDEYMRSYFFDIKDGIFSEEQLNMMFKRSGHLEGVNENVSDGDIREIKDILNIARDEGIRITYYMGGNKKIRRVFFSREDVPKDRYMDIMVDIIGRLHKTGYFDAETVTQMTSGIEIQGYHELISKEVFSSLFDGVDSIFEGLKHLKSFKSFS